MEHVINILLDHENMRETHPLQLYGINLIVLSIRFCLCFLIKTYVFSDLDHCAVTDESH